MMQKMVREFAEKELAPGVAERDEKEEFLRELYDKAGELGLTGICFPEEYGGAGATMSVISWPAKKSQSLMIVCRPVMQHQYRCVLCRFLILAVKNKTQIPGTAG